MMDAILWCTACGASTKVVNKTTHERNCRRGPVTWTDINPHKPSAPAPAPTETTAPRPTEKRAKPVTHEVSLTSAPVTHAQRQAQYRARHGDSYRERHTAYMRTYRKRATQKNTTITAA